MKTFNSFSDAFKWTKKVVDNTTERSQEEIAREVYKDSKAYTYLDTEEMYQSGEQSNFKEGEITLKAPQVRKLYFTFGLRGHKNPNAVPYWFDLTVQQFKQKYLGIVYRVFSKGKDDTDWS